MRAGVATRRSRLTKASRNTPAGWTAIGDEQYHDGDQHAGRHYRQARRLSDRRARQRLFDITAPRDVFINTNTVVPAEYGLSNYNQ